MPTILDKSFLDAITNPPPELRNHSDFVRYIHRDIGGLLRAELLSHIIDVSSWGEDSTFLLYRYRDKYIFIEIKVGTCSDCLYRENHKYNEYIMDCLSSCYITTSKEDIESYYREQLGETYRFESSIYYVYPKEASR